MSKWHHTPYRNVSMDSQLYTEVFPVLHTVNLTLMLTLSIALLIIFFIRRQSFFNQLYANLILCSLVCSAIARPAAILSTTSFDFEVTAGLLQGYCTVYVLMLEFEAVGVPLAVFALIVECTVHFSWLSMGKPLQEYKQKLSGVLKVFLLALPWITGLLTACVKTFGLLRVSSGDVRRGYNDADTNYYSCHINPSSHEAVYAADVLLYSVRSGLPLVYLCLGIVVMLVYRNKAKYTDNEDEVDNNNVGKSTAEWRNERVIGLMWRKLPPQNYQENIQNASTSQSVDSVDGNGISLMEGVQPRTHAQEEETTETDEPTHTPEEPVPEAENGQLGCLKRCRTYSQETTETHEPADKTNATVGIVMLLAATCACVSVRSSILVMYYDMLYPPAQWLYFMMEFTAVMLAYCFIPEIRGTLCCRRCTHEDQGRENEYELERVDVGSSICQSDGDQDTNEQGENNNHAWGYSTTRV